MALREATLVKVYFTSHHNTKKSFRNEAKGQSEVSLRFPFTSTFQMGREFEKYLIIKLKIFRQLTMNTKSGAFINPNDEIGPISPAGEATIVKTFFKSNDNNDDKSKDNDGDKNSFKNFIRLVLLLLSSLKSFAFLCLFFVPLIAIHVIRLAKYKLPIIREICI